MTNDEAMVKPFVRRRPWFQFNICAVELDPSKGGGYPMRRFATRLQINYAYTIPMHVQDVQLPADESQG